MNINIVMHERYEAPGAIELWVERHNHTLSFTRLYEYEQMPDCIDSIDLIIIMGGPQSPASTLNEFPHFNAGKEIAWIKNVIDQDKKVLGICLGAQLIGEALGARFVQSPSREIGVFDLKLTEAGTKAPFFSSLPSEFGAGHWHNDMPGLTKDSVVLAYSQGCPRQIVRYTSKVYGFQCHMEFTQESIEGMITHCPEDLKNHDDHPFVESAHELRKHDFDPMNQILFRFLDFMSEFYALS